MSRLSLLSKNPLVLVVPIVISLLLIWQQYVIAQPQVAIPKANILPNAGLDELDERGLPIGWQLPQSSMIKAVSVQGHNSPAALSLINSGPIQGDSATLISPLATVQAGETYFYKSFYKSNVVFDLLLRFNKEDGSYEQEIVGRYNPSEDWETVSHVFISPNGVRSVQLIYSFAAKGELSVDNSYLEANPPDVYVKPQQALNNNKLQNVILNSTNGDTPDGWSEYSIGKNVAALRRIVDTDGAYLRTQITDYVDGEAKWQYNPVDVKSGQSYIFNVLYQGDAPAKVIAEYNFANGDKKFETISDLLPIKEWTKYSGALEVPYGAKNLIVSVVQQANGTVNTKDYGLYDTTKPGDVSWDSARLSVTFDDGWESAYSVAKELLDRYGYVGTFYLNPSTIDTARFMDSNQVAKLAQSKHEIASHGYEHINFTTLDRTGIDYQFKRARDYFTNVQAMNSISFAVPFGGTDAQTNYYARKYYSSLRGTTNGINTRQNIDTYNLRVFYVGKAVSLDKLAAAIAETNDRHGWLILVYHRIETTGSGETIINPAQFQQQLDVIKKSDIRVMTVSSTLQEIGGP